MSKVVLSGIPHSLIIGKSYSIISPPASSTAFLWQGCGFFQTKTFSPLLIHAKTLAIIPLVEPFVRYFVFLEP